MYVGYSIIAIVGRNERIRSSICVCTRAQATRECKFYRKFVSAKVCRLLVKRDLGLKKMYSVTDLWILRQNQGAGYSWIAIFIKIRYQQKCVGYSWIVILAEKSVFGRRFVPNPGRRLLVNGNLRRKLVSAKVCRLLVSRDFGLKRAYSVADLCRNQGAGYSWMAIFIANWCQQKCVGYSWFAIFGPGWSGSLLVKLWFLQNLLSTLHSSREAIPSVSY